MITNRFVRDFNPDRYLCSFEGGGNSTVASSSNPSPFIQPYVGEMLDSARLEFQRGPKPFYPGSTVVPFSAATETALGNMQNIAGGPNPLLDQARGTALSTIRGDYLDPSTNPAFQKAAQDIGTRVDSLWSGAGRYKSGGQANQLNEALSNLAAQTYGAERQNQLAMTRMAPQLRMADYLDPQMLAQVGAAREGQAGAELQGDMARFQHQQGAMDETLRRYATLLQGGNVQGQVSQPIFGNPGLQAAGLGLGALSTAGSLFGANGAFGTNGVFPGVGNWLGS